MNTLIIEVADPTHPICAALVAEQETEVDALYADLGDDDTLGYQLSEAMNPRSPFVVAWSDGEAVGCAALRPMPDDPFCAEVKRVYVRPAWRGRGFSKQIMTRVEAIARAEGYTHICLETGDRQIEAIRLYEGMAYERIPCYGKHKDDPISMCYGKELK